MHELSLTRPVIEMVMEYAKAHHAKRVTHVTLLIGPLHCAQPQSISWCFEIMTKNTLAQNAQLFIEEEAALSLCCECRQTYEPEHIFSPCPHCQSTHTRLLQGQSFTLRSIRVDH